MRWLKQESEVALAIKILIEAHSRLKAAIKEGEPTSYFAGGQRFGTASPEAELEGAKSEEIEDPS